MFQEADAGALNPKPQTLNLKPQTLNPIPTPISTLFLPEGYVERTVLKQTTALHKAYYKGSQKGYKKGSIRAL